MLRIPNTDLAPFAICEFCKSMQTHGNGPHEPEKYVLVYRISEVRRSGVRSAAECCIKSVKNVFRARTRRAGAMRGSLQLISRVIVLSIPGYGSYTYPKEVGTILRKASNFFAHE